MVDRQERRRLRTRKRLIDAAEQVFGQKGYQEASVLDITETADVSKRTFYLHFSDKEAVIEALALRGFDEMRARVQADKDNIDESVRDGFQRAMRTIFTYATEHPDLMQTVFGRGGSFRLQTLAREYMVQAWEDSLVADCDWREDAPIPTAVLANAIAGIVHQLLCWWIQKPNDYSVDEIAAMCTSMLFNGIEINFEDNYDAEMV